METQINTGKPLVQEKTLQQQAFEDSVNNIAERQKKRSNSNVADSGEENEERDKRRARKAQ